MPFCGFSPFPKENGLWGSISAPPPPLSTLTRSHPPLPGKMPGTSPQRHDAQQVGRFQNGDIGTMAS